MSIVDTFFASLPIVIVFVVDVISFVNRVVICASFTLISDTFIEPVVSILLVIIVSVCILLTSIDADFITDDLISLVVMSDICNPPSAFP